MEEKKKNTREIDLLALAEIVLKEWRLLIKFASIAAVIGIVVALNTPKDYKAEVILAPELSSGGLGLTDNIADMAANFGIDIAGKSSMDAIYPELYPDIFSSTKFVMSLFDIPVRTKDDDTERTYYKHITEEQKSPFWNYPKMWLSNLLKPKDPLTVDSAKTDKYKISRKDDDICRGIRNAIMCTIDKKTSVISISVTDQDPLVAAIVADTLQKRLQTYITDYRTRKARNDYNYYKDLTIKAKAEYEEARQKYGNSYDGSTHISLRSVELRLEGLENDMQLKFNTYSSLNSQLEAAKAKVQEKTPAFTIIENPIMPYKASSIPRSVIVLLFMFMGAACDVLWILYGREWYKQRKANKKKE
jgi:uncharacterized protein involved in exopolysaccharide biosynthesis